LEYLEDKENMSLLSNGGSTTTLNTYNNNNTSKQQQHMFDKENIPPTKVSSRTHYA